MQRFVGESRLFFRTGRGLAKLRPLSLCVLLLLAACAFRFPIRAALAEGGAVSVGVTSEFDAKQASAGGELSITGWQGAKNYQESFPVNIGGGFPGGTLRFLTNNCSVSPSTGTAGDTYTVTVTGAGTYSMTAVMAGDGAHGEISESRSGAAGKADQAPLSVIGWGNARNYYRTFTIQVAGGTTKGAVHFEVDGCSVSPTTGSVGSVFTVTVTRVGAYALTAVMDGNGNYAEARSAKYTGMSGKSDQASIMIEGWVSTAYYGDAFPVKIAGGSTSEPLTITASGCDIVKEDKNTYTVTVSSVGPYSVTASRAGNYGYNNESASACGVSKRASQPSVSISGWSEKKNVADSFSIRVKGGMTDGAVHFATTGCTIKPTAGTTADTFIVTVDTVGTYALTAFVDGDDAHLNAVSREHTGTAGKAVQPALNVVSWNESAPHGGTFDVAVTGGGGTGGMTVTTDDGCIATPKRGEDAIYTINVTAGSGEAYTLRIGKAGDANYADAATMTLSGVAGKSAQTALNVNGWKDAADSGDEFAIQIAGGDGEGRITFETVGCTVSPESGDIDDVYQVIVTAPEGESYSLSVNRAGDGIYANVSTLRSGSVWRKASLNASHADGPLPGETETPLLGDGVDVVLLIGVLAIMLVIISIALVLQNQQKRNRYARSRR